MTSQRRSDRHRGAGILIVRMADMKILLIKRSREVPLAGYWGVAGGKVEPGEIEPESAVRECQEELGGLPQDLWMDEDPSRWDGPSVCFATFLGTTADRHWEPVLNFENDDWGWFSPRRLPTPWMPSTMKAIEDLLR